MRRHAMRADGCCGWQRHQATRASGFRPRRPRAGRRRDPPRRRRDRRGRPRQRRRPGTAMGTVAAEQVPCLRALLGEAVEWVQLHAGRRRGLVRARAAWTTARVWTSAAGAYAVAVAEHILALAARVRAKRLPECARSTTWRKPELEGVPLSGSTVGIVGAGAIGRETIRRLAPFDVRVIALDALGPRASPGAARSLGPRRPGRAARESDYVVLCPPLTPGDRGPDRRPRARAARARGRARERRPRWPRRHRARWSRRSVTAALRRRTPRRDRAGAAARRPPALERRRAC